MSDMVERVATAIAEKAAEASLAHNLKEIGQEDKFSEWQRAFPIKVTDNDRALARAAIEAMREPTKEMVDAHEDYPFMPEAMSRMIDAALTPRKPS